VVVVEFFDGPTKIGQATNSPFVLDWIGATVGTHELSAVATDERGASNTSSPVEIFVVQQLPSPDLQVSLIQTGAVWRYHDTGLDQGTSWVSATFNDSAWAAGPVNSAMATLRMDGRATGLVSGRTPRTSFQHITSGTVQCDERRSADRVENAPAA
jgi:hypothetical protein